MENPYDDSNLVPLGESLNSIDTGKVESELQKIIEEDVCGLSWNDWLNAFNGYQLDLQKVKMHLQNGQRHT